MKCAQCRSENLRWSNFRAWEFPIRLFGLRPYLCRSCRKRDWMLPGNRRARVVLRWSLGHSKQNHAIEALPEQPVESEQAAAAPQVAGPPASIPRHPPAAAEAVRDVKHQ